MFWLTCPADMTRSGRPAPARYTSTRGGTGGPTTQFGTTSTRPSRSTPPASTSSRSCREQARNDPSSWRFTSRSSGPERPLADPTKRQRDVVHQVPDPGDSEVLERRHQPEPADAHQVPGVRDVRAEGFDRPPQGVDVHGVDQHRPSLEQVCRDRPAVAEQVVVPDLAELQVADDPGRRRDGSPRRRGQHEDVVAAGAECLDGLPAAELVAADHVGRIEVGHDQDLHAATPGRRSRRVSGNGRLLDQDVRQLLGEEGHPVRLGGRPRVLARPGRRGGEGRLDPRHDRVEVEVAGRPSPRRGGPGVPGRSRRRGPPRSRRRTLRGSAAP